uniref:TetR/AcrR family transcriptional regulator n=1 Tax=Ningiella ruwaisensis TaxID=2364274 RepID=UPI001445DDB2|nr:TetR/AcrR family transcriptional regulator [Ningiella ruwaisensis]
MPKQAKYKLENVLERALTLVMQKGYRGCSMQTLIAHTGFNRRAFYMHFKNKEDFFEALLQHYLQAHLLPLNLHLHTSTNAQKCVQHYFEHYRQHIANKGCLLTRLIVEMGNSNHSVQHHARWFYDQLQLEFIGLLERAQQHGDLSPRVNIEHQALKLTCLAQGFTITSYIKQGDEDIGVLIQSIFDLSA